jgi:hypothetical protein
MMSYAICFGMVTVLLYVLIYLDTLCVDLVTTFGTNFKETSVAITQGMICNVQISKLDDYI